MFCLTCQQPLIVLEFDNVELDHCLTCGGIWLDAGELGLILHGTAAAEAGDLPEGGRRGARACPMCREKMYVTKLVGSGVEVDHCPRKHGIWLDRGELQQIIAAAASNERTAKLSEFCARVFRGGDAVVSPEKRGGNL